MTWAANEVRAKGRILIDLTYNGRGICRVDADQAGELMDLLRDRFEAPDVAPGDVSAITPSVAPTVPETGGGGGGDDDHWCALPNWKARPRRSYQCPVCGSGWHTYSELTQRGVVEGWRQDPGQPHRDAWVVHTPRRWMPW